MSNHITSNGSVASNVKRLSRLDIPGGGQVEVNGDYAYIGHMTPPHGTSIIDVSDPRKPTLVYAAWFSGGLRVVDITDPFLPVERGFFIPEPAQGAPVPMSNEVDVDGRGLIYLLDRINGLDILELEC
ncbi:MAG: hypothetical protein HKP52_01385 [Desulfofustis sp.]|nr:hypothetical protein [Desulfofustis sp.]